MIRDKNRLWSFGKTGLSQGHAKSLPRFVAYSLGYGRQNYSLAGAPVRFTSGCRFSQNGTRVAINRVIGRVPSVPTCVIIASSRNQPDWLPQSLTTLAIVEDHPVVWGFYKPGLWAKRLVI